jgi:hypothetical protein
MKFTKIFLSLSLLFGLFSQTWAQIHEVGIQAGAANYRGDLAPIINLTSPGPMVQGFYRANVSKAWSFRGNVSFGRISYNADKSSDNFIKLSEKKFRTNIWELSGQIEYNFLSFRGGRNKKVSQNWTPYAFSGVGVFKFEQLLNLQPTYGTAGINVPLGVGIKVATSRNWNFGVEFGARFTFTDYLDDLGLNTDETVAPIPSTDPRAKYREGNPNTKDMYFFTGFSVSYVVRSLKKDCPIQVPN